ncbi:hypothetical protein [Pseudomonas sp. 9Ag]|uniref:hypothetical protein n=1 Tax=Pseudomonas sp. 9Ag TaxID=2653167 RepID=UPI0012EF2409|nr:hypothetical protein [Pseudomonas sp. 9Ag]VXC43367.1 conserved hypothetical protein [Pseudomonas sp. 9Ag]
MATKKPAHPLRASEVERFEQNLANWLKLAPSDAMYHRFQGILESQIVTLQICGVITSQGAVKLHVRMGEARREKDTEEAAQKTEGLKLV